MIDHAEITIKAGDGGNGLAHFLRSRHQPKGGPDGGDGGDGGSIYLETDRNLNTLTSFRFKKRFEADNGQPGGINKKTGRNADDLVLKVPIGTLVKFVDRTGQEQVLDLSEPDLRVSAARGGRGGKGNWHFRSSSNQVPMEFEEGTLGEERELILELKLLADVGLIGLPNVGKSTLLSVLTKARPVIANYPFTTLVPNLGVMERIGTKGEKNIVVADIPGLIEGASKGKGLGDDFLRHVERTKVLVHVVAPFNEIDSQVPDDLSEMLWNNYQTVRTELKEYNLKLVSKKEVVILNKCDVLSEEEIERVVEFFSKQDVDLLPVSAATGRGLDELKKRLMKA